MYFVVSMENSGLCCDSQEDLTSKLCGDKERSVQCEVQTVYAKPFCPQYGVGKADVAATARK